MSPFLDRTHGGDMGYACLLELRAKRSADETARAGHQHFARRLRCQAHFQPCLLKKRTALVVKRSTWRHPLRAAPPP